MNSLVKLLILIFANPTAILASAEREDIGSNHNRLEKSQEEYLSLQVFNPDDPNDKKNLTKWFCATLSENTEDFEFERLKNESCTQNLEDMCEAFHKSVLLNKTILEGLTRAQCLAVTMYSTSFYVSYNNDIRNGVWRRYNVFTALLQSAIQMLDKLYPLPPNTTLYRGLSEKYKAPNSNRIYFKHFISTTLDKEVIHKYGMKTIIEFIQVTPIIAANIMSLSKFPEEHEILLSPFEAFKFVNETGNVMRFKTAFKQDLITRDGSTNIDACDRDSSVFNTLKIHLIFILFILQGHLYFGIF